MTNPGSGHFKTRFYSGCTPIGRSIYSRPHQDSTAFADSIDFCSSANKNGDSADVAGTDHTFLTLIQPNPPAGKVWPRFPIHIMTQTTDIESDSEGASAKRLVKGAARGRLEAPASTVPLRIDWRYLIGITAVHLLALLAFLPWFFSWTGVALAVLGHYFVGTLGIGVGYHRLLTHRSFKCSKRLEHLLATLGVLCLQDTPARWVAIHRMHHQHSEDNPDPHSPLVSFLWSHVGWLVYVNRDHNSVYQYERYVHDLLRDRYYRRLERWYFWAVTYVLSVIAYSVFGFALGWGMTGELLGAVQMASSVVVWGVFVRTLSVWHATWSVNSIGHLFGYRNYETSDNSRNSFFVGLFATGEGWHNNHHADPNSAKHGHKWWELDVAWLTIWFMEKVGLAHDVKRPRTKQAASV